MKRWFMSKMVIFNSLVLFAGVLGFVAAHDVMVEYPEAIALLVALQGAANIVLRFLTHCSIK